MGLTTIDWVIMAVYFALVLGIGAALKRYMKTSADFFLAGYSFSNRNDLHHLRNHADRFRCVQQPCAVRVIAGD